MPTCSKCKEEKPLEDFNKGSNKNGKCSSCKVCRKAYRELNKDKLNSKAKLYRELKKEDIASWRSKNKEYLRTYRARNPEKAMYGRIKTKCKLEGIPFNLEVTDIVIPTHCPILGIPLSLSNTSGQVDTSPSLDKYIPSLGYVKGNVNVISMRANVIKNSATTAEVRKLLKWMEEQDAARNL
jgi:hypothetical protein